MADGLWEAGKGKMVYYLDNGNPTSPQRVYNPHQVRRKKDIYNPIYYYLDNGNPTSPQRVYNPHQVIVYSLIFLLGCLELLTVTSPQRVYNRLKVKVD